VAAIDCAAAGITSTALARRLGAVLAGLLGGVFAAPMAHAVDLPEDRAEAMYHVYDGGGTKATGPALLVRKKIADKVSLTGSYYIDMVSNASIDVVTQASAYKENRSEYALGLDYAYRDSLITLSAGASREPDYTANRINLDISQEVFGGMTTVALGYTRGADKVGKKGVGFFDDAQHWQYRFGITQILTPRVIAAANFEAISDSGYLGSPYRSARVFGAYVHEEDPRTRTSRAMKFRLIGDVGGLGGDLLGRTSLRAEYRYFWDTWAIKAHTLELGASHYFGDAWLADAGLRYYTQQHALFYSDNAPTETRYFSRNRQLSTFNSVGLSAKLAYTVKQVPGQYDIKLNGAYERVRFKYADFTDVRTGAAYAFDANVLQLFVSATF